jgi:hypothetical protein
MPAECGQARQILRDNGRRKGSAAVLVWMLDRRPRAFGQALALLSTARSDRSA